ncbi:MAG: LysM peptidoglycan-binding domain-containing protein, partial [Betaproteobacteria bacterium]
KGETLSSIAARYDVSAQDLKGWNAGLTVAKVVPGQRLRVVSDSGPMTGKKSKRAKTTRAAKPTAPARAASRIKQAYAPPRHRRRRAPPL